MRTLRCSGYSYVDSPGTPDPLVKVNSTVNLKSNRVNLIAQASPIEYLLYLPNVWAIQYKLGPERLTRLGNSNELRLPVSHSLPAFGCNLPFNLYFPVKVDPLDLESQNQVKNISVVLPSSTFEANRSRVSELRTNKERLLLYIYIDNVYCL